MSQGSNFDGGKQLVEIQNENPSLGRLLQRTVSAINRLASNAGVSPVGQLPIPPTIGAINVKASGETVHVTVDDASEATTNREWFIEHATEPNFIAPHVVHLKSSRGAFLNLPSKTDAGTAQGWYFRGYSQDPGSPPSAPVYFGGLSPTKVTLSGSTQLTPLASTGSGTASPLGTQGGWGRGKIPVRPAGSTTGRP
jgi:hypothetical protein